MSLAAASHPRYEAEIHLHPGAVDPVLYISTRGDSPALAFDDVVLAGLARDGGLFVPQVWPRLSAAEIAALGQLSYPELTARLLARFADPVLSEAELALLAEDAYRSFDGYPAIAPLKPIMPGLHLLELFHGPTLAFKDYALQVLGRLFDLILARRGERITIVGATSGDTGSAAIEACRDRACLDIFVLHPRGRVSDVQRRQMTTVLSENVHNIAIEGTFDDCQNLVKALFGDVAFRDRVRLAAVNSINWARIAAQIVYYAHAALRLAPPGGTVTMAVPTGNFGNVLAAYGAARIGLPIGRMIVASNRNDILTRFFMAGTMQIGPVYTTLSPSMDIQVSSNFERYLFELYDRDASAVNRMMREFRDTGTFAVEPSRLDRARRQFAAACCDDAATTQMIRSLFERTGEIVDPHTAVGLAAVEAAGRSYEGPMVAVATAHPAKFPDAVEAATGVRPPLPPRLADLLQRPERLEILPVDLDQLRQFILARIPAGGASA